MTKRIRTITGFLMGLFMVLSIMAPSIAMAATARPETGNLHIHKVQTNYADFNDDLITNDGTEQDLPSGATFLQGAEFSVYKVADDADMDSVDLSGITPRVVTTDSNGLALFENLDKGRYYVVETERPKGVEEFSGPFLVDVPMMNTDGTDWNQNVHVYPKNQLILGAVELIKWDEDGETGLPGAVFDLYKVGDEDPVASNLETGSNGKILVGDLVVGSYYFVETDAPDGYGLNTTPIPFEVTESDHAYGVGNDLGNLVDKKVIRTDVELTNFLLPANIDKYVTSINNKVETADYGENIKWIIVPDVPADIENYESFKLVDTFGSEMDFNDDVTLNGGAITDFTVTFAGNILTIDITPGALEGVTDLTVEFTTSFNETAVMGMDYYNNVDLEFDSGYVDDTISAEEPPKAHTGGKPFMKLDNAGNPLAGAIFVIHDGNGKYLQDDHSWGDKETAREFESLADGTFEVKGLAYDDYYLEETKAPLVDGVQYRLLDNDEMFTVDAGSYYTDPTVIESPDADPTAAPAEIENSPEITLPQTGGVGTLVFSIIGLGLMGSSVKLYKKSEK